MAIIKSKMAAIDRPTGSIVLNCTPEKNGRLKHTTTIGSGEICNSDPKLRVHHNTEYCLLRNGPFKS